MKASINSADTHHPGHPFPESTSTSHVRIAGRLKLDTYPTDAATPSPTPTPHVAAYENLPLRGEVEDGIARQALYLTPEAITEWPTTSVGNGGSERPREIPEAPPSAARCFDRLGRLARSPLPVW